MRLDFNGVNKSRDRKERLALIVVSFSIGFFAIISQVLFVREILVVFYGNELCVGLIFSFWLAGIFLGALIASYGRASFSRLVWIATSLFILLALLIPAQLVLIRLSRIIFSTSPGEYIQFLKILAASSLFVSPASMLVGALFPIVAKLFSSGVDKNATAATNLYVWEAVGSLIGGILFTFLLAPFYDSFTIIILSSCLPIFSILMLTRLNITPKMRNGLRATSLIFFFVIILSLSLGFSRTLDRVSSSYRWTSFASTIKLVKEKDSKYQYIAIAKQDSLYSIYLNGQYQNSFPDPYQSTIKAHIVMSEHPHPVSILVIGAGYTGLLEEMLKYPVEKIDYVELDPVLIPLVSSYMPRAGVHALSDPRMRTHAVDGRHFLKFTKERYDIILINSQDPSSASANRYYTLEFFREASDKLKPAGLFVTTISSSLNYFGEDMLGYVSSVYRSVRSIFRKTIITPTEEAFIFASNDPATPSDDPQILANRFLSRNIHTDLFSADFFKLILPPDRVEFIRTTMEQNPSRELNTDFRPVTYFYSLKLWAQYSGSSIERLLSLIEKKGHELWYLFASTILFLFLALALPLGRKERKLAKPPLILCMASTGFSGMAWSLILIFSFQNILGYIYGAMGILVALFMLGLALGGVSMRILYKRVSAPVLMLLSDLLILSFSFLLMSGLRLLYSMEREASMSTELFFSILMFASGFLTGLQFPVAIKLYLSLSSDIRRSAGIIDGADHIGATLGALLTGVLFIPLAGLWSTTLAVASLKVISSVILLVGLRSISKLA